MPTYDTPEARRLSSPRSICTEHAWPATMMLGAAMLAGALVPHVSADLLLGLTLMSLLLALFAVRMETGVVLLLLTLPFYQHNVALVWGVGVSPCDIVGWPLLVAAWLKALRRPRHQGISRNPPLLALCAFMCIRLLSVAGAVSMPKWLVSQASYLVGAATLLVYYRVLHRRPMLMRPIARTWVFVGTVTAMLGIVQYAFGSLGGGIAALRADGRVTSIMLNPNSFGILLVAPMLFSLSMCRFKVRSCIGHGACLLVMMVALVLSRSVGALSALGVGLAAQVIGRRSRLAARAAVTVVLLVGVLLSTFGAMAGSGSFDLATALPVSDGWPRSYRNRLYEVTVALDMTRLSPWVGIGGAQYKVWLPEFDDPRLGNVDRPIHNTYLGVLVQSGVLGMAGFLLFLSLVSFRALDALRGRARTADATLLRALLGSFVGQCVYGLTHDMIYGASLWILAGLLLAQSDCTGSRKIISGQSRLHERKVPARAVGGLAPGSRVSDSIGGLHQGDICQHASGSSIWMM